MSETRLRSRTKNFYMQIRNVKKKVGRLVDLRISKEGEKQCLEERTDSRHCWSKIQSPRFRFEPFTALHSSVCLFSDAEKVQRAFFAYEILAKWEKEEAGVSGPGWRVEKGALGGPFISYWRARHISWRWIRAGGRLINVAQCEQDGNLLCRLRSFCDSFKKTPVRVFARNYER